MAVSRTEHVVIPSVDLTTNYLVVDLATLNSVSVQRGSFISLVLAASAIALAASKITWFLLLDENTPIGTVAKVTIPNQDTINIDAVAITYGSVIYDNIIEIDLQQLKILYDAVLTKNLTNLKIAMKTDAGTCTVAGFITFRIGAQ